MKNVMSQTELPLKWIDTRTIPENFSPLSQLTLSDIEGECVGFDIETNDSVNPYDPYSEVMCLAISGNNQVFYLHKRDFKQCLNLIRQVIESPKCMLIGHNIKFDLNFMTKKYGWTLRCLAYDTMLAAYFLNEEDKFISLKELCERYKLKTGDHKSIYEGRKIMQLPYNDLVTYNGNDARACAILKHSIFDSLLQEQGLDKIMGIACEAIPILSKMETRGIKVDMIYAKQQQLKLYDKMISLRTRLKELSETIFSPDSPKQLAGVLYGKLGFIPLRMGILHGSTDYESIIRIRQEQCDDRDTKDISFIDNLIEYNKLSTLNEKYYNKLAGWIQSDDAIHTNYNIGGTDTGRLSSSSPNMQNQKRGSDFRGVYIPRPGYTFLEGDWAAIEMRFAAHFANETRMINMFKQCLDVHTATMCEMKGWNYDEKKALLDNPSNPTYQDIKNLRVGIKNFNFGEIYGAGVVRLQRELVKNGIYWSLEQCSDIYYERKRLFPNIVEWKKVVSKFIVKYKYVRMPFGQIRRLPLASWDVEGRNWILKGINFIIQSTASGWFPIIGMILLDHYFQSEGLDAHILLNVHDSILCEVKVYNESRMKRIKQDFQRIMEYDILEYIKNVFNFQLSVPLEFKAEYMERWR